VSEGAKDKPNSSHYDVVLVKFQNYHYTYLFFLFTFPPIGIIIQGWRYIYHSENLNMSFNVIFGIIITFGFVWGLIFNKAAECEELLLSNLKPLTTKRTVNEQIKLFFKTFAKA